VFRNGNIHEFEELGAKIDQFKAYDLLTMFFN